MMFELYKSIYREIISLASVKHLIPKLQEAFLHNKNKNTYNLLSEPLKIELNSAINKYKQEMLNAVNLITDNTQYKSWIYLILRVLMQVGSEDYYLNKIKTVLNSFFKVIKHSASNSEDRNIMKYKSLDLLLLYVEKFSNLHNINGNLYILKGLKFIYKNDLYIVYFINSLQQSVCELLFGGNGYFNAGWCVTRKDNSHFSSYILNNRDEFNGYFVFIHTKNNKPYALLHFGSYQFKDINNKSLDATNNDSILDCLMHITSNSQDYQRGDLEKYRKPIIRKLAIDGDTTSYFDMMDDLLLIDFIIKWLPSNNYQLSDIFKYMNDKGSYLTILLGVIQNPKTKSEILVLIENEYGGAACLCTEAYYSHPNITKEILLAVTSRQLLGNDAWIILQNKNTDKDVIDNMIRQAIAGRYHETFGYDMLVPYCSTDLQKIKLMKLLDADAIHTIVMNLNSYILDKCDPIIISFIDLYVKNNLDALDTVWEYSSQGTNLDVLNAIIETLYDDGGLIYLGVLNNPNITSLLFNKTLKLHKNIDVNEIGISEYKSKEEKDNKIKNILNCGRNDIILSGLKDIIKLKFDASICRLLILKFTENIYLKDICLAALKCLYYAGVTYLLCIEILKRSKVNTINKHEILLNYKECPKKIILKHITDAKSVLNTKAAMHLRLTTKDLINLNNLIDLESINIKLSYNKNMPLKHLLIAYNEYHSDEHVNAEKILENIFNKLTLKFSPNIINYIFNNIVNKETLSRLGKINLAEIIIKKQLFSLLQILKICKSNIMSLKMLNDIILNYDSLKLLKSIYKFVTTRSYMNALNMLFNRDSDIQYNIYKLLINLINDKKVTKTMLNGIFDMIEKYDMLKYEYTWKRHIYNAIGYRLKLLLNKKK